MPPPAAPVPRTGDEILMAFAGPARQRRLTVLFRLLLVIPHLFVLFVLGIAAIAVTVAGWFAALFIGRLPAGIAGFLVEWLRWNTRVSAYVWLLTDQYPPFTLSDPDYPVRMSAAPGQLNRVAVLFRLILVIPAYLLTDVVGSGLTVLAIVIWLIVLVAGQMPRPLHEAVAAVVRFLTRYDAYLFLMSGTYPWWGLFGDQAGPEAAIAEVTPLEIPPGPEPWAAGAGQPAAQPESWQPAGSGAPAPSPAGWPAGPQPWRLVLSSGGRSLVGVIIAVGALAFAVNGVVGTNNLNSSVSRVNAIATVSEAHTELVNQIRALGQQGAACQGQASALACVQKVDRQAAQDLGAFANAVGSTPMPSSAASAASQLTSAVHQAQMAFQQLATATSVTQYEQIAATVGLTQKLQQSDTAYTKLGTALGAG
jgi:hypothetical protein